MNKCSACSATLNEKAKFCKECGTKVNAVNVTSDNSESIEENQPETNPEVSTNKTTLTTNQRTTITLDWESIKRYAIEYGQYLKELFLNPYTLFKSSSWLSGLISLVVFSLIQMFVVNVDQIATLLNFLVLQAISVVLLLVINKGVLKNAGDIYDVLTEYGGLMNTQSILFIVAGIVGIYEDVGSIILFIALLNQFNIYNYYLFNNQTKGKNNLDGYYQIVIAYIALSILAYYAFRLFLFF